MIEKTVCIAALFLLALPGASQAQTPIVVTVNGDAVAFAGQPPVSQNGRLLVPLRGVLEKIGAMVRYSGPTKTIAATKGDINIQLTLGETSANVSGRTVAFRKNADLTYQGQKIGFDDLRSGDKIVATLNRNSRGIGATVSDSEE